MLEAISKCCKKEQKPQEDLEIAHEDHVEDEYAKD